MLRILGDLDARMRDRSDCANWGVLAMSIARSFTRQQPLNTFAEPARNLEKRLAADLALALFVTRQLSLADAQLARKLCLLHVEPAQLAQPAANSFPVNGLVLGTPSHHRG